jgi:hypothetical protein
MNMNDYPQRLVNLGDLLRLRETNIRLRDGYIVVSCGSTAVKTGMSEVMARMLVSQLGNQGGQ